MPLEPPCTNPRINWVAAKLKHERFQCIAHLESTQGLEFSDDLAITDLEWAQHYMKKPKPKKRSQPEIVKDDRWNLKVATAKKNKEFVN